MNTSFPNIHLRNLIESVLVSPGMSLVISRVPTSDEHSRDLRVSHIERATVVVIVAEGVRSPIPLMPGCADALSHRNAVSQVFIPDDQAISVDVDDVLVP